VDVIVSGHTSPDLRLPELGGALATSAGAYGRFLTRIELTLDPVQHRCSRVSATQVAVTHDLLPIRAPRRSWTGRWPRPRRWPAARRPPRRGLTKSSSSAGESTLGDVVADAHLAAGEEERCGDCLHQLRWTPGRSARRRHHLRPGLRRPALRKHAGHLHPAPARSC
jgi:5'-nucleotidase